jgi:hypothetical protein
MPHPVYLRARGDDGKLYLYTGDGRCPGCLQQTPWRETISTPSRIHVFQCEACGHAWDAFVEQDDA